MQISSKILKIWFRLKFQRDQNRRKMSFGSVWGCKKGLLGPKNPKILFYGRFRPNFRPYRPKFESWILADMAGNSAGIGRKIYFLDSLAHEDPFCTLERLKNSFCGDCRLFWSLVVLGYFEVQNSQNSVFLPVFSRNFCTFSSEILKSG